MEGEFQAGIIVHIRGAHSARYQLRIRMPPCQTNLPTQTATQNCSNI